MLVGNKCDKTYEQEVSCEEGIALGQTFGCEFMETSTRMAYNVEFLFINCHSSCTMCKGYVDSLPISSTKHS